MMNNLLNLLNLLLSPFKKKPLIEPDESELQIIRLFAVGEASRRDEAVAIFNKYIKIRHKYLELQFMSEETSKYPDIALKIILFAKLRHIEAALKKKD